MSLISYNLQTQTLPDPPARRTWCQVSLQEMIEAQAMFCKQIPNAVVQFSPKSPAPGPAKEYTIDEALPSPPTTKNAYLAFHHILSLLVCINRKINRVSSFDPFNNSNNRNVIVIILTKSTLKTNHFKVFTGTLNHNTISNIYYPPNTHKQHVHTLDLISPFLEQLIFQKGIITLHENRYLYNPNSEPLCIFKTRDTHSWSFASFENSCNFTISNVTSFDTLQQMAVSRVSLDVRVSNSIQIRHISEGGHVRGPRLQSRRVAKSNIQEIYYFLGQGSGLEVAEKKKKVIQFKF